MTKDFGSVAGESYFGLHIKLIDRFLYNDLRQ